MELNMERDVELINSKFKKKNGPCRTAGWKCHNHYREGVVRFGHVHLLVPPWNPFLAGFFALVTYQPLQSATSRSHSRPSTNMFRRFGTLFPRELAHPGNLDAEPGGAYSNFTANRIPFPGRNERPYWSVPNLCVMPRRCFCHGKQTTRKLETEIQSQGARAPSITRLRMSPMRWCLFRCKATTDKLLLPQ
jgi:hypothetical protein